MDHKAKREQLGPNANRRGLSNAEQTSLDLISVSLIKQQPTVDSCWGKETLHKA